MSGEGAKSAACYMSPFVLCREGSLVLSLSWSLVANMLQLHKSRHCWVFLWPNNERESSSGSSGGFFFFIFKKNKISKIYVGFGKFQKYTPVALWGATGLKCNFFLQICNEVPGEKKRGGLSPPQRATGPCRPWGGRQGPLMQIGTIASVAFFFICSSLLVRLLYNFWYLKELCISCSLLTMMALHRIFTISM